MFNMYIILIPIYNNTFNSLIITVQPTPGPNSIKALIRSRIILGGSSQNAKLFTLGKAVSIAPT